MRALLEQILARHTGQTEEKIKLDIERDTILTADQAKDYGIVDAVITTRKVVND
jgi:ATP-dependent Clp protease protease subunit